MPGCACLHVECSGQISITQPDTRWQACCSLVGHCDAFSKAPARNSNGRQALQFKGSGARPGWVSWRGQMFNPCALSHGCRDAHSAVAVAGLLSAVHAVDSQQQRRMPRRHCATSAACAWAWLPLVPHTQTRLRVPGGRTRRQRRCQEGSIWRVTGGLAPTSTAPLHNWRCMGARSAMCRLAQQSSRPRAGGGSDCCQPQQGETVASSLTSPSLAINCWVAATSSALAAGRRQHLQQGAQQMQQQDAIIQMKKARKPTRLSTPSTMPGMVDGITFCGQRGARAGQQGQHVRSCSWREGSAAPSAPACVRSLRAASSWCAGAPLGLAVRLSFGNRCSQPLQRRPSA